tara:strand:+ start:659 stop:2272 length:1614 start_codon:yes stop_codon:yes gene_type:complete
MNESACRSLCVYGECSGGDQDYTCHCKRGYFTSGGNGEYGTGDAPTDGMGGGFVPGEYCNVSVADVYFVPWVVLRVVWGLAFFALLVVSLVYIRRLGRISERRKRKMRGRGKIRGSRRASVRVVTFTLIATTCVLRLLWNCVDPIGAFFFLSHRATAATLNDREHSLMGLRFYDQTLNTLGYCLQFSITFVIASFWVRVALRFQGGDRTDRFWARVFAGLQVGAWVPLLIVTILIGVKGYIPSLVLAFNGFGLFMLLSMVVTIAIAYCTVHKRAVGTLSLPVLRQAFSQKISTPTSGRVSSGTVENKKSAGSMQPSSTGSGRTSNRPATHGRGRSRGRSAQQRGIRNMGNMLRLVVFTQIYILAAAFMQIGFVASSWSKSPTGYMVNIGFGARLLEFAYMAAVAVVMRVGPPKKPERATKPKGQKKHLAFQQNPAAGIHKTARQSSQMSNLSSARSTVESVGWLAQLERKERGDTIHDSDMSSIATTADAAANRSTSDEAPVPVAVAIRNPGGSADGNELAGVEMSGKDGAAVGSAV